MLSEHRLPRGALPLPAVELSMLVARFGGELRVGPSALQDSHCVTALAKPGCTADAALVAVLAPRAVRDVLAEAAPAVVLLSAAHVQDWDSHAPRDFPSVIWVHPAAASVLADLLADVSLQLPPAQVDPSARIETGVVLAAGVVIGAQVIIGAHSVIGRRGFGFVQSASGLPLALPHWGGVVIGDHASIGAGCTIDAGMFAPTELAAHVHLDSQVHIGHNTYVGSGTLIAAQSGLGGSVRVGVGVQIGGQVGIADHVEIGDFARIAAKSGVIGNVPARAAVAGYPAVDRACFFRAAARSYARSPRPRAAPPVIARKQP